MPGQIIVRRDGAVATLVIANAAKRNSLDFPLLADLTRAADDLAADDALRCVVLRGDGDKAFCAGADFDAFILPAGLEAGVMAMEEKLGAAMAALDRIAVPIVAGIAGACFGAGVQVALAADLRIAGAGSRYGIPAVQIGMPYPLAAIARIVGLMGQGSAAHTLLTAEPFDAATALRRNLVDEVVADDALDARLSALAQAIAAFPPEATRGYKAMIRDLAAVATPPSVAAAHRTFADAKAFLPKLEEVAAKRAKKG
jgi:enoyl-CoA hydratase